MQYIEVQKLFVLTAKLILVPVTIQFLLYLHILPVLNCIVSKFI